MNTENKTPLVLAAITEISTGVAMLAIPSRLGRLLLGTELTGVTLPVARVFGIAVIALGVACWPGRTALCGMLTYNALLLLYLVNVGVRGEWVGPLLWPVVALHAVLTFLLARSWLAQRRVRD